MHKGCDHALDIFALLAHMCIMKKQFTTSSARDRRVNIVLPADLVKKIDNWRRRQQELPNMSEAVRQLLERAVSDKASTNAA